MLITIYNNDVASNSTETDEQGCITVPVMNLSDNDYKINEGDTVTRGVLFTEKNSQLPGREVNTEPIREEEIVSDLSTDEIEEVCEFLTNIKD